MHPDDAAADDAAAEFVAYLLRGLGRVTAIVLVSLIPFVGPLIGAVLLAPIILRWFELASGRR